MFRKMLRNRYCLRLLAGCGCLILSRYRKLVWYIGSFSGVVGYGGFHSLFCLEMNSPFGDFISTKFLWRLRPLCKTQSHIEVSISHCPPYFSENPLICVLRRSGFPLRHRWPMELPVYPGGYLSPCLHPSPVKQSVRFLAGLEDVWYFDRKRNRLSGKLRRL